MNLDSRSTFYINEHLKNFKTYFKQKIPVSCLSSSSTQINPKYLFKFTISNHDSLYNGIDLKLIVEFTKQYPYCLPNIFINPAIFHPNVNIKNGKLSLSVTFEPEDPLLLIDIMKYVILVLDKPNVIKETIESANENARILYCHNIADYNKIVNIVNKLNNEGKQFIYQNDDFFRDYLQGKEPTKDDHESRYTRIYYGILNGKPFSYEKITSKIFKTVFNEQLPSLPVDNAKEDEDEITNNSNIVVQITTSSQKPSNETILPPREETMDLDDTIGDREDVEKLVRWSDQLNTDELHTDR